MLYENVVYDHMGLRTFIIILLKWMLLTVPFIIVFLVVGRIEIPYMVGGIALAEVFYRGLKALIVLIAALGFCAAYLEHRSYSIALTNDGLKVWRGLLSIRQNSVAYARIRDVTTHRSLFERILGISTVIVNLVGDVDETFQANYHISLHLPYLHRKTADAIHNSLFDRIGDLQKEIVD